tara:strand:+ start:489 stop:635 length:147 start_codon:yes stop_codon:yes gene_type:complete
MKEIASLIIETINNTKNDYDAVEKTEEILTGHFAIKKIKKSNPHNLGV